MAKNDRFEEILVALSIPILMLMEDNLVFVQKDTEEDFSYEIKLIQTILAEKQE